jgi:hypothetical protein
MHRNACCCKETGWCRLHLEKHATVQFHCNIVLFLKIKDKKYKTIIWLLFCVGKLLGLVMEEQCMVHILRRIFGPKKDSVTQK